MDDGPQASQPPPYVIRKGEFEYFSGSGAVMAFAPKEVVAKEIARMEAEREAKATAAKKMIEGAGLAGK